MSGHLLERAAGFAEVDWSQARCSALSPEEAEAIFFDERKGPTAHVIEERAREICVSCPLLEPCLLGALERNESGGFWGGASLVDRQYLRLRARKRRVSVEVLAQHYLAQLRGWSAGEVQA